MKIEKKILQHLLFDDDYTRQVVPHLDAEYFNDQADQLIFELISRFVVKYNKCPSVDAIHIEINEKKGLHQNTVIEARQTLEALKNGLDGEVSDEWLINKTEEFCKQQAIYRAVAIGASIVSGTSDKDPGILPKLLQDALAVSFDKRVGHNYVDEWEYRWEKYHTQENKVPFDIDILNTITDGGVSEKTINVLIAPTGVGKTLCMCHMAAANLSAGKNVLYITLEMSEIEISKRIDVNLLDIPIEYLKELSKPKFEAKIKKLRERTKGRLIIKEFPTKGAHVGNIAYIIHELKIKQNFVPDIIYVDYINNVKDQQGGKDSYTQVKNVTEDLRGLAIVNGIPLISATQVNRDGAKSSDINVTHTSESFGLPMTVDLLIAVTKDPDSPGQYHFKQIKSRYGSIDVNGKFMIGVDYSRMRLYQLAGKASQGLSKNTSGPKPDINTPPPKKNGLFDDFAAD